MIVEFAVATQAVVNKQEKVQVDRKRMDYALSSGVPVKLPAGLSREEKRRFIMSNS
jgi:hypothetical protein